MKKTAAINGFGRFGLHLLKYWLDRAESAHFSITHINDDFLSIQDAYQIITTDKFVIFNKYKVSVQGDRLTFLEPNGARYDIQYSKAPKSSIPWLGKTELVLECSGKSTVREDCTPYLVGDTQLVIISATSWDAEKTLVYGFNHETYNGEKVVSYGSCTVNAYVPLAQYLHKKYGTLESDANFIHNIQSYRLDDFNTLNRKFCTLEKSGPNLLGFIDEKNFTVNYTVIPYDGVSTLDLRFKLKNPPSKEELIKDLEKAFVEGELKHLYHMDEVDIGPEVYNCTTYSSVFIKDALRLLGDNLYLFGYFDNENSVNRYFDLVHYLANHSVAAEQRMDNGVHVVPFMHNVSPENPIPVETEFLQ